MPPRPDRLPPLTALRAFEAAARHMSFQRAADELAVTPAALSYQIRQLEEHLGLPLFRRLNRAVELTEAGRRLQPGTAEAFGTLRAAVHALDSLRDDSRLTVTAAPAFTAKWLAPRIFHFVGDHPEIEVRIVASLRVMDLEREGVDAAIRFGLRSDPALYSQRLVGDRMTPMCAPGFAARVLEPGALSTVPLIHDDSLKPLCMVEANWGDWLEAAGIDRPGWERGARFSNAEHALAAATDGGAVVLGRTLLAEPELRRGLLVAPFDLAIDPEAHFSFLCPKGAEKRASIRAFLDWLRAEVAATPDPAPHLRVVRVPRLVAGARAVVAPF